LAWAVSSPGSTFRTSPASFSASWYMAIQVSGEQLKREGCLFVLASVTSTLARKKRGRA
jgi:hypothetical protein